MTGFSVIIPSKGRSNLIAPLLESIRAADNGDEDNVEILVMDDTVSDDERREIEELCRNYSARYCRCEATVSSKRNQGAEMASRGWVIFLDSDVKVCKELFTEYEDTMRRKNALIAIGVLEFYGEDNWYWGVVKASPFVKSFDLPRYYDTLPWGCSCNMAVNRDFFLSIGGFSEDFKYPAGEDVDLGLRISEQHIPIYSAKGAIAYHSKETWSKHRYMKERVDRYGRSDEILTERHPGSVMKMWMRRPCFYLIFCLIAISASIIFGRPEYLIPAPVAIACEILIVSFYHYRNPYNDSSYLQTLFSYELVLRNENAYIMECLRRRHFRNVFRQFCSVDGQAYSMLETMRFVYIVNLIMLSLEAMAIAVL